MKNMSMPRLGLCFGVAVAICGCSNREAPKVPLNRAQAASVDTTGAATTAGMSREAQMALDSGNILYRAKAYDGALAQYRRAAELAPAESAPLVGIMMIADATKNAKLANSTLARMQALNSGAESGGTMSQAEIRAIHSGMKKEEPSPTRKK